MSGFRCRAPRLALSPAREPPLLALAAQPPLFSRAGEGLRGPRDPSAAEEAAPLMPLLVTNAAHGLQLRLVGVPFIPVAVLAPFQHVLAPAVAGKLIADPPARESRWCKDGACRRAELPGPASDWALPCLGFLHGSPTPLGCTRPLSAPPALWPLLTVSLPVLGLWHSWPLHPDNLSPLHPYPCPSFHLH